MTRRGYKNILLLLSLLASSFALIFQQKTESDAPILVSGTEVIDGDTIRVQLDDKDESVRVVGIDTPETVDPRQPVECMGEEASDRMRELVENRRVRLEPDPTQSDRDRYGRLLRYVFLEDDTDAGLTLIEEGYAQSVNYGSQEHERYLIYEEAENKAREANRGLWNNELCPES